jgi:hypothetical protein
MFGKSIVVKEKNQELTGKEALPGTPTWRATNLEPIKNAHP